MAWTPAIPKSKIVANATDSAGKAWNETLGYAGVNVFSSDASAGTDATILKTFAQGIIGLTNGVYQKTTVTYEIELDTLAY